MVIFSQRPILLVGIGGAAWWVMQGFQRCGIQVNGFIVTDPTYETEEYCCDLPVYKAKSWQDLPYRKSEYTVVIGVMNPVIETLQIKSALEEQGWQNIYTFSEFARYVRENTGVNCCMLEDLRHSFSDLQIQSVNNIFYDSVSKNIFEEFINYCSDLRDTSDALIEPSPYYAPTLPRWNERIRIVDCGSFDGGAVKEAVRNNYSIELAICLEPDYSNYHRMVSNLQGLPDVVCLPLAVGDQVKEMRFNARGTTGSRFEEAENGQLVQCVTLDSLLPSGNVNLIKMDIEGAEYSALLGARNLIVRSRPGLAISVYHLTGDIMKIPQLLFDYLGNSYEYYLRRHSRTIADTILYAFPKERR